MVINYSTSIFYLSCSHNNNLYDQLNYNLLSCNCTITNKFCYVNFAVHAYMRYTYPVTPINNKLCWNLNGAKPFIKGLNTSFSAVFKSQALPVVIVRTFLSTSSITIPMRHYYTLQIIQ